MGTQWNETATKDQLLSTVAMEVQTLCVLGTKSIYIRAWCVGEITSATSNGVPTVLLSLPGHTRLNKMNIKEYNTLVPDIESLLGSGISLELVQQTLSAFMAKSAIIIPHDISSSMSILVGALVDGDTTADIQVAQRAPVTAITIIVSDSSNFEANAAAHVLEKLLAPKSDNVQEIPKVLPAGCVWGAPRGMGCCGGRETRRSGRRRRVVPAVALC